MWQWLGALGIVFSVLFVGSTMVFSGNEPDIKANAATVVSYFNDHRTAQLTSVFLGAVAALVFAFFLSALRRRLCRGGSDGDALSTAMTIGGAVYVGGFLLMAVVRFAELDAAHLQQADVVHVLNVVDNDDFFPVVVGLAVVTLATGIAALVRPILPRWLGWASIILGVLAVAGPLGQVAFVATPLWTLAIGVVLARGGDRPPPPVPATTLTDPATVS
jgi:hypothetical protein